VRVEDCNFAGSHDDAINVHGTNLRIVEKLSTDKLLLRFMHHQTYGINAFHVDDTVAFVNPNTMLRTSYAVVKQVDKLNPRTMSVTLDRPVPGNIEVNKTCLENITCTPTVYIGGCSFTRHSTRGILVTTPRKVVIENNKFSHLGMAAILIEGDAAGWYESGPVKDVTISGNEFMDCGFNGSTAGATIALNPSNKVINPRQPVHENVRITGNRFNTFGRPILYAKSTSGIVFSDNAVEGNYKPLFILNGCMNVKILDNFMVIPEIKQSDCINIKVSKANQK
ncbi:MAG: right-handed parallel beta-helix repeat-containing protein, partial [Paramuribaculum sp.]|nr:right-handed parallel beta-helix repeat-containing protein [Paramuribaculum sp.]